MRPHTAVQFTLYRLYLSPSTISYFWVFCCFGLSVNLCTYLNWSMFPFSSYTVPDALSAFPFRPQPTMRRHESAQLISKRIFLSERLVKTVGFRLATVCFPRRTKRMMVTWYVHILGLKLPTNNKSRHPFSLSVRMQLRLCYFLLVVYDIGDSSSNFYFIRSGNA